MIKPWIVGPRTTEEELKIVHILKRRFGCKGNPRLTDKEFASLFRPHYTTYVDNDNEVWHSYLGEKPDDSDYFVISARTFIHRYGLPHVRKELTSA